MPTDESQNTKTQRKLAAILAADIAGYSTLMGSDEARTVRDLKAHQAVILPMIGEHGGRVIDTAGDGVLAEFSSVVNAVECALAVQKTMAERNSTVEAARRMQFRIGINQGDVVHDETRIYGDGVNVAARLEGICEPGGICISGKVYDELQGRTELAFRNLGEQQLKNIARLVRVYAIGPMISAPKGPTPPPGSAAIADKASIAVLPFDAMGGDHDLEAFSDGLTEDIITGLSHLKTFWVIARNTMFTYKGRAIDVRAIGRDLCADYVLEGSVRKAGQRIRVTGQLLKADLGHHLWSEKMDRLDTDLFELQDEFTRSVVSSVQTQLVLSDATNRAKREQSGATSRLLGRAEQRMYELNGPALMDARRLAAQALQEDPASGLANRIMAAAIFHQAYMGYVSWDEQIMQLTFEHARRATQAIDADDYANWTMACAHLLKGEHDLAIISLRRALQINPNFSLAFGTMGSVLAWRGQAEESIRNNELAVRINPRDPSIFFRHFGLALAHYLSGRYQVALDHASQVMQARPTWFLGHLMYAACLAQTESLVEAQRSIDALKRARPDVSIAALAMLPFAKSSDREHFADGLRKAGLRESRSTDTTIGDQPLDRNQ